MAVVNDYSDLLKLGSLDSSEDVEEVRHQIHSMKQNSPLWRARDQYRPGARFLVATETARLEGIVVFGRTSWSGWSRNLAPGEIVTFDGWKPGWHTPDALIATFRADRTPPGATLVSVWPLAGLFLPYPLPGVLMPLPDEPIAGF